VRDLIAAVAARCDLLGFAAAPLLWLTLDVALLVALAGGVVGRLERAAGGARWGAVRTLLASGLVGLAVVVLSATLLGAAGRLSAPALLAAHAAALVLFVLAEASRGRPAGARALAGWCGRPLAALAAPWRRLATRAAWRRERAGESIALAALLAVLLFYLALALFTVPFNHDSNTYRLSRLAYWLQEGSNDHFPATDDRQNWIGQNTELVMLWLTGFFRRQYPLVKLAQYGGGVLACLATVELGAWLGLARRWQLGAALVLVGIPTVATQFISSQADLFTAGCLAAGLAFLPAALGASRRGEWLLVGAGVGLAAGAKATVFYWGPGLVALLALWAWLERTPPRALVRGGLAAAAVAATLGGYNFALNQIDFDSAVAPARQLRGQGRIAVARTQTQFTTTLLSFGWQLFEPHSNPLLPRALHEPGFTALLDRLAEWAPRYRELRDRLPAQGGWRTRGLNEDEASFGLLVAAAATLGAAVAAAGALRRRSERARALGLAVAVGGFLLTFSLLSGANVNQFRYLCLLGPFAALLAVEPFARGRSRFAAAAGALLLAAQAATAAHVGVASRNQGLAVLRSPEASRWFRHWDETRRLADALGDRPLRVGLALRKDSWLAPLYRRDVAHRWVPLPVTSLRPYRSLADALRSLRLDAVVGDPYTLHRLVGSTVAARQMPTEIGVRRAIYRPLAPGERFGPRLLFADGLDADRWTRPRVTFFLAGWEGERFALAASNPTPLARRLELMSGSSRSTLELAAGAAGELAVVVGAEPVAVLEVSPPYVPAEHGLPLDVRQLGVLLPPSDVVEREGIDGDGWSAPRAALALRDWTAGAIEIELVNASPLARTLRVASARDRHDGALAPGETRRVRLAAGPFDRVEIEVSPPFVPRDAGAGDDARELGALVRVVGDPDREPAGAGGDGR